MGELRPADVQLAEMAARLRLTYTRDHLAELAETAATSHMTPRETLEYVFRKEIEQRDGNRVRLAQMSAHFPFAATMDGFDMSFQPSIDPGKIRELVSLGWVVSGENVILIGPSGVGKTHLSIALGQLALQRGLSVRFYSVTRLVEQMEKLTTQEHLMKKYGMLTNLNCSFSMNLGTFRSHHCRDSCFLS